MKTLRHERNLKLPIKLDDFTINDLKDFEKELGYVKNFKVNNIITENNKETCKRKTLIYEARPNYHVLN